MHKRRSVLPQDESLSEVAKTCVCLFFRPEPMHRPFKQITTAIEKPTAAHELQCLSKHALHTANGPMTATQSLGQTEPACSRQELPTQPSSQFPACHLHRCRCDWCRRNGDQAHARPLLGGLEWQMPTLRAQPRQAQLQPQAQHGHEEAQKPEKTKVEVHRRPEQAEIIC